MAARLEAVGFHIEHLRFGEVDNLWATHGNGAPLLVLAGHTDVVPSGPESAWNSPPFEPTVKDGVLIGRGAADMKGSLAAMVVAAERFLQRHGNHRGTLAFLITSDEEGPAKDGTVKVVDWLTRRNRRIDYALVGEPSSREALGDVVKIGRRGSLNARMQIFGTQGHVAYPHLVDNPIHRAGAFISQLAGERWDNGNSHFPPTSLQISNIHAGTGAENVVPGELELVFNFRFSTELTAADLKQRVTAMAEAHALQYSLQWSLSGNPFLTRPGAMSSAVTRAIEAHTGLTTELSTDGGTSDGRFIAPTGAEVIELGPINKTIHKINEQVAVADLELLTDIYAGCLENLLIT